MDDMTHVAILLVKATPELPIVGAASGRAKVLGYDAQALRGMPLSLLCPLRQPDGRPSAATLDSVLAQLQQGGSLSLPWTFQTRAGEARPHELHLTLTERDGEPQVAVCMVDVSRMQFAEVLNRAKNELLEMVATGQPLTPVLNRLTALIESQFEGLYCSVLLLDLDGRHVHVGAGPRMPHDYMQALEGAEIGPTAGSCGTAMFDDRLVIVDDIATHPLWAAYKDLALPYGFKACWSAPIHAANQGVIGSFAMYYREVRRPSPEEISALNIASHLAGIAIDQARRDEERRRAALWLEEQVQARTQELLAAQDELVNSRKLAALGQLLAGIAHEMNTPLGNALLSVSALRAGSASFAERMATGAPLKRQELVDWVAQAQAGSELVEQNVDRALRLVNRFKQLTEGSGRAVRSRFDLREAVLQAWARVQTRLAVEHVQLACDLPEGFLLEGYSEVLQQVLEQLLENACLHAFRNRSSGQIRVSARRSGERLTLELSDNGAGMPAADLARAFEPFFTTTFGQGGSGLGLFVAHSLVSGMLGGSLELDSQPGQGTVARLELPIQGDTTLALAA
ncbi:signal transduction histidine kinase [Pelomonas saccharophila]|uniref:histidine kinase n=1 Tax=Roseateles saccharophilus TaxID=304 RepID=A0ABU1YPH1_ROSSA|nr:GAF domain-containing sensor histidine kinase [Roseateles saccharophilus]MDR7270749.1 signal transduction histidine kinase [Roseateles saccharophilus]